MTIRRLNFTARQRIRRSDVVITLEARDGGQPTFSVLLDLDKYHVPASALVSVEAYRGPWMCRKALGTASTVSANELGPYELDRIDDAAGVKFRVKVSATEPPEERGRILAAADRLAAEAGKGIPKETVSMLPLQRADLGELVWRVDCDSAEGPILLINRQLELGCSREPQFRALVLPAALQQILDAARLLGGMADDVVDDENDWRGDWLRFGYALAGAWPSTPLSGDADAEWENWCQTVTSAFAARHRFLQTYVDWREERES